jgi:hypothetical protein
MKFFRKAIFVGVLALSLAAAALAQDNVSINDGRVNQNQLLGGIGIFCEDQNGVVSNNYTNGGISVWGAEGEKYLFATAEDIAAAQSQFPLVTTTVQTDDQAQQGAQGSTTGDVQSSSANIQGRTGDFTTLRIGNQTTGLIAAAQTARGPYNLYAAGDETFYLIGLDEYGRQFLYRWTGCTNANSEVTSFGFPLVTDSTRGSVTTPRASITSVAPTNTPEAAATETPEATETVSG